MCRKSTLATNGAGKVELCSCGTTHLTIGSLTVRLPAAAIPALKDLLETALDTVPERAPADRERCH